LKEQELPVPIVPSQTDPLREIGERLGLGKGGKSQIPLDSIVYYFDITASLDNLTSVWNALT